MTRQSKRIDCEIERYLATGDSDPLFRAWGGGSHVERMKRGHEETIAALVEEVRRRTAHAETPPVLAETDLDDLSRRKAGPMVRGLFPKAEQEIVVSILASSVVFLTPDNIERVLRGCSWLSTAWTLAHLYLGSVGADPMGGDAPSLLGLSEEQTCYVSPAYFSEEDPYADFVVHEMAHIFHNCKRRTIGLKETRKKEWLLDIGFAQRENFAYACEAYSCILERTQSPLERRNLAEKFDGFKGIAVDKVNPPFIAEMVRQACEARNGWKVIAETCR